MKSESCGCCNAWIDLLEESGFEVEVKNLSSGALNNFKIDKGIAPGDNSCHTGIIDGYVIESHVPAVRLFVDHRDVRLDEVAGNLACPRPGCRHVSVRLLVIKNEDTSGIVGGMP